MAPDTGQLGVDRVTSASVPLSDEATDEAQVSCLVTLMVLDFGRVSYLT